MKTVVLLIASISIFGAGAVHSAENRPFPIQQPPRAAKSESGSTEQAKSDAKRAAEKAAVVKFINANRPENIMEIRPVDIVDFGHAHVGGTSYLIVVLDFSGRGYSNTLWVYNRDREGLLRIQEIEAWKMGSLKEIVRDLDHDGNDELILPQELGQRGIWYPLTAMPTWPAVYRFENGKYVDDSRDFPGFYDEEILPKLNSELRTSNTREGAAIVTLEKDKILRVLGRNPTAGLNEAYQWMNSDDPQILQCAAAAFRDIGGHQREVREAEQKVKPAFEHEIESRNGG